MKNKFICTVLFWILVFSMFAQADYQNIQVKSSFSGSWVTKQAKLVNLLPDFASNPEDGYDDFTRYGTYRNLKTEATGFFYVKKIDGRWWLIDPNGNAGINMAVTSFGTSNIQTNYDLVRRIGFNGTGNFLTNENQTKTEYNVRNFALLSYTRRLNFFLNYKNVRKNYYTTPTAVQGSLDYLLVFDPQFTVYCDQLASDAVNYASERELLGWFTDNELNFNQDQLQNLVKDLPAGDPSRNEVLAFAVSKGFTENQVINGTVSNELKEEFAAYLADHYYKTVSEAIRKYDPNHLILGSRLHGRPRAIHGVVAASQKYMDVTSVNFYDRFSPDEQIADQTWTNDKPAIVTEFYIKDINNSNSEQSGAGWYVNSQSDRGKFYQNTCLELLKNKSFIGWQYFRFSDDADGSNKGIVDIGNNEYTEMTAYMDELNKQVYRIIDYYDGIDRRPNAEVIQNTLMPVADTYIVNLTSDTTNYGISRELEIGYSSDKAARNEAFLKFDLNDVSEQLPNLKNAMIEVSNISSDQSVRKIYISGLKDVSWLENTLNGSLVNANNDWKQGYNRLAFQNGVIDQSKMNFNVTNWILDKIQADVSFKIHDLQANVASPLKIASRENNTVENIPKLKLVFWNKLSSVDDIRDNELLIRVYPNPVVDKVFVESADNLVTGLEIIDLSGRKIVSSRGSFIDLKDISKGVYIIKIIYTNGYKCQTLIKK
ncbi:MAG: CBM96 family carbohydrate-binding protein [Paludibacteraceae bacterium]